MTEERPDEERPRALKEEDLAAEDATELPDREEMSLIPSPIGPPVIAPE